VNPETIRNWLQKADNGMKIAKDQMQTKDPVTDMVCFHMQQACEKYLKTFLISRGSEYPRTHDIGALIDACARLDPDFRVLEGWGVDTLTAYAVELRYSEDFFMPSEEETKAAIELGEKVREFVLGKLRERGFQP